MPNALKIFLWSLLAGVGGGYLGARLSFWVVEHYFPREPMAAALALVATGGIGVASAVTAGVIMGKQQR